MQWKQKASLFVTKCISYRTLLERNSKRFKQIRICFLEVENTTPISLFRTAVFESSLPINVYLFKALLRRDRRCFIWEWIELFVLLAILSRIATSTGYPELDSRSSSTSFELNPFSLSFPSGVSCSTLVALDPYAVR